MSGCLCQQYGKTGVPHRTTGRCLVCGLPVDPTLRATPLVVCPVYRPDHNGECLLCDEGAEAHTEEAIAAGAPLAALGAHDDEEDER